MTPLLPPPSGRLIGGRYRLDHSIGRGGMGTVWAGRDELLDRAVAVKEVRFPAEIADAEQAELRERTLREARATARLSHPNVVTTYDVVEEDGRPWIVMELLPSRSLSTVLREDGPLPPDRVAEIGLALLAALDVSHQQGVVHRDVKPGNVLLTADGRPVLTDFGIATMAGDPSLTSTGVVLGSPAYMSPERARGQRPGPEADLWSLGATLYAAAEGRPPFDGGNSLSTLTSVIADEVESPSVDGPLREVILGLLAKDPAARLKVAEARPLLQRAAADHGTTPTPVLAESVRALDRAGRTEALPLDPPAPAEAPAAPRPGGTTYGGAARRRSGVVAAAVLLAVLLVGAGLAAWLNGRDNGGNASASRSTPSASSTSSAGPSTSRSSATSSAPSASSTPPSQSPSAAGAGFRTYRDPTGFSMSVPTGWVVTRDGSRVRIDEPGTTRYLLVDQTSTPKKDPAKDWQKQEKSVSRRLPNYQRLSIAPVDFRGYPAADWQFTYATRTQVINRGFVVGGRGYALYLSAPRETWDQSMQVFQEAASSFQPAD
jgi:serine/threonine protein kinase